MATPRVYFKQLELGPMQNFIYLIGDPATREAAVVDPGWDVPAILKTLQRDDYRLTRVFVTHYHFDHTQGVPELLEAADVPVYAHRDDQPYLDLPASSLKLLRGGEEVRVGGVPVSLLHTPGHTPGSQCLLVDGKLLSGDTLFIGACGRCDLPGGDARALYESLAHRLRRLDDETVLCPGHHYAPAPTATLGQEKRSNPFLSSPSLEDFLGLVGAPG